MKYIFLFFLLLTQKIAIANNVKLSEMPKWYLEKPKNTKVVLYGIGEGFNKSEAINFALYNISKELLVSIEVKTTSEQVEENKKYVDSFRVKIEEKVPQLNFPKYTVVENSKKKNTFYVLISINRKELFDLQISDLEDFKKSMNKQQEILLNLNDFAKIDLYNDKIFDLILKMKEKIVIIKYIDYFNDIEYRNIFGKLENDYNDLLKKIDINIIYENLKLKELEKEINEFFIKKHIKINKESRNSLFINLENRQDNIYGNFIMNSNLILTLKENNKIVKYKSKNFSCTSSISYSKCFENIIINLKQHIKDKNEDFF